MVGPSFRFDFRLASAFTTASIALLYGAGLPILFPIAALTFFITFWCDRAGLIFLYRSPGRLPPTIVAQFVGIMPFLVLAHVAVGAWMLSRSEFFGDVGMATVGGNAVRGLLSGFSEETQERLSRAHIVPLLILLSLIVFIKAIETSTAKLTRPLRHLQRRLFTAICCLLARKNDDDAITYSHACENDLMAGVPTYNVLRNPTYAQMFRISDAFARKHKHMQSVYQMNVRDDDLEAAAVDLKAEMMSSRIQGHVLVEQSNVTDLRPRRTV
jgi:hypothetical protein|tara:strand:- start:1157 stop:1966 length:810 start_codon:yes stop_codon:yes gene_type:complete